MERVKCLGRYQKGVLLLMIIMILAFVVLYSITISRVGYAYKGGILVPKYEDGSTVYSGKIHGAEASFTIYDNKSIMFQYDDKTYGLYTAEEDSTAIPKDSEMKEDMIGVELRKGEEIIFRGGVLEHGDHIFLYNEDGSDATINVTATMSDGTVIDADGNEIDLMEPFASTILSLMTGTPELTHKGNWLAWFGGVFICIINALLILFADELFRCSLKLQIRNADNADYAEPSDWEIAGRYISWTVLQIMALVTFIAGLQ